uniref:von Willebrand factor A domain-containing protein 3B n=1 Tax=Salvator merianae TaxID=96440 RepID=A0A8D0E9G9_SALMN
STLRNNGIPWDLDVQLLISSAKWLQLHGLKKNKLTFPQILSQIGFQHKEDYVSILGKLVASRYANGLYHQCITTPDGKLYNLTAKKDLLFHFVDCLTEAIELYKQRMEWLTTESRQIFGVIQEQCITIILDFGVASRVEFNLCQEALSMVFKQQVAQIAKFNLIWGGQDLVKWQEKAVPVTEASIQAAVEWLWAIDHMPAVCHTGPTEAIMEALFDDTIEAVYYFVVGDMPECMKHLLLQKITRSPCPVHTVSFNAREEETIAFLKELSQLTTGSSVERQLPGKCTGVREDVYLIWKELEEARNTLIEVQNILGVFELLMVLWGKMLICSCGEFSHYHNSGLWVWKSLLLKTFGLCLLRRRVFTLVDFKKMLGRSHT